MAFTVRDQIESLLTGIELRNRPHVFGECFKPEMVKWMYDISKNTPASISEITDQILNLFLQSLKNVKPLGDEEMKSIISENIKLLDNPEQAVELLFIVAQASHQNVIDQIKEMMNE